MDDILLGIFVFFSSLSSNKYSEHLSASDSLKLVDIYAYDWMETRKLLLFNDSTFQYYTGNNHTRTTRKSSGEFIRTDSIITLKVNAVYSRRKKLAKTFSPRNYRILDDCIHLYYDSDTSRMEDWEIRHSILKRKTKI